MSRSAIDLTRFTATVPHAYSKISTLRSAFSPAAASVAKNSSSTRKLPSPPSHSLPSHFIPTPNASPSSPPRPPPPRPSETPAEKVARLRSARFEARKAQFSLWDRMVVGGRIWADRLHRITVYFLLLVSVISVGVTIYALSDMLIYNRRKRAAWYKDQALAYQEAVTAAIDVERSGKELNEEQRLVLGRERVRVKEEEAAERRKHERWWITSWLLDGLKTDDEDEEGEVNAEMKKSEDVEGVIPGESLDKALGFNTGAEVGVRVEAEAETETEKKINQSPILRAVEEQQSQLQSQSPTTIDNIDNKTQPNPTTPNRSWWSWK